jgi:hypothetical protein
MSKITAVVPCADYLLTVRFDNNHAVTMDLKEKLYTARFSELRNKLVFNTAKTDGKSVYWPGGISIAISEIMEIVTK